MERFKDKVYLALPDRIKDFDSCADIIEHNVIGIGCEVIRNPFSPRPHMSNFEVVGPAFSISGDVLSAVMGICSGFEITPYKDGKVGLGFTFYDVSAKIGG